MFVKYSLLAVTFLRIPGGGLKYISNPRTSMWGLQPPNPRGCSNSYAADNTMGIGYCVNI